MVRVTLGRLAAVTNGADPFLNGITDIEVHSAGGGSFIYTTTRPGSGGIAAYRLESNGSLTRLNQIALPSSAIASASVAGVTAQITATLLGNSPALLATGTQGTGLWAATMLADGSLGRQSASPLAEAPTGKLALVKRLELGGQTYFSGSVLGSTAIEVWRADTASGWQSTYAQTATMGAGSRGLTSMETVLIGGNRFLLTTSDGQSAMTLYQLNTLGQLTPRSQIGMENGLWITDPAAVRVVALAGQTYAIVAGTTSNSISVVRIDANGVMRVVDHLIDTLDTRFAGINQLETLTLGDRVYLVAAGSDDGISLFQLLPGGRLLHLTAVADALNTSLQNVSGLALVARGSGLQVIAAGSGEAGLTLLWADLGLQGRQLLGGGGNDTLIGGLGHNVLSGGAGNDRLLAGPSGDILMDGAGIDTLTGGAGEDIFILSADNSGDEIRNFDPNRDWLDLSNWALLRNGGQLDITPTATGAIIRFRGETLVVHSSSGAALSVAAVQARLVMAGDRILPEWFNTPPALPDAGIGLIGSAAGEVITGMAGPDYIVGQGGNDTLLGLDGNDTLDGGAGADLMNGGRGSDVYYVDNARDLIVENYRWQGYDEVFTSVDYSVKRTHIEKMTLIGNARIGIGNVLDNVIIGTAGNDTLDGGSGNDTLIGGRGNDVYIVQQLDDVIIERPDEGLDIVKAYRSTKLSANVENLYLQAVRDASGNFIQGFKAIGNELGNVIVGNPFDNELTGREGNDTLRGHLGADSFIFDRAFGPDNIDHIVDFTTAEGDRIGLKASLFGLPRGGLAPGAFRLGTAALDGDDRIIYDRGSGHLWVDLDGRGGADAKLFAVLDNHAALTASDFLIL